jgi:UDPglucose--hexose-1-phosphate uridylyltransferase
MDLQQHAHRRYNPLTREWVLVSPYRTQRPWLGQVETAPLQNLPPYDPACYLCPGNVRANGHRNPNYQQPFVYDNDFPALLPDAPESHLDNAGLLVAESERGICRVVCFSPQHNRTLACMPLDQIRPVVDTWADQFSELIRHRDISHVQIFENRGELMGSSNPHPHCQIWANQTVPNEIAKEQESLGDYAIAQDACLLCDYLALERKQAERIICENNSFVQLVPFWAYWPFETMLLSKRHVPGLDDLSAAERADLAEILKCACARYDNLFSAPFPYAMGFHQRLAGEGTRDLSHLHAHYYPPLLRSATVRKFVAGYELFAMPQRDFTPESAAQRLREVTIR